jgi:phosphatidylglycerophosphatase A
MNDTLEKGLGPRLAVWLATGFGIGLYVPAPGTFGAALGVLLAWGIHYLPHKLLQFFAILVLNWVGVALCAAASRRLGGETDHPAIIWDEIASVPLVFLFLPPIHWVTALAGFAFHRLFDIWKPTPVRDLEGNLPGGWGIMADDWAAAVYACLALQVSWGTVNLFIARIP